MEDGPPEMVVFGEPLGLKLVIELGTQIVDVDGEKVGSYLNHQDLCAIYLHCLSKQQSNINHSIACILELLLPSLRKKDD